MVNALLVAAFLMLAFLFALITGGVSRLKAIRQHVVLKCFGLFFTSIFVFIFALILIINFFFFETAIGIVLDRIESRTGITVTFDSAEGSLFTGKLLMKGVTLKREKHPHRRFDLKVKEVSMDMDMTSLMIFRMRLEEAGITGLKGVVRRVGEENVSKRRKRRKNFVIEKLVLKDADLDIFVSESVDDDGTENRSSTVLYVERLESSAFHSRTSVYDFLFRSHGKGILKDSSFLIEKYDSVLGNAGQSRWYVESFPVELLAAYIGGPMVFIVDGGMELEVKNYWWTDGKPGVRMDWNLTIRNIKAKLPEDYSPDGLVGRLAGPVVAYINDHPGELNFQFRLDFEEEAFRDVESLEEAGVWKAVRKMIVRQLLKAVTSGRKMIENLGKKGYENLKDLWNRL